MPSQHRIQVRHHAAVLGITHVLYVKSSPDGIIYSVLIKYDESTLNSHREEITDIVVRELQFIYQKEDVRVLPLLDIAQYRHAQEPDGFMYTLALWRSVDAYIRREGHFKNGASITPGPHGLWPKLKPFVDVMSRYMTHIEAGRRSNLNLSQFAAMRFLNYLLYNAYIVSRSINVAHILDSRDVEVKGATKVLAAVKNEWKKESIRVFVSNINNEIRKHGTGVFIPDVARLDLEGSYGGTVDGNTNNASNGTLIIRRQWPKRNRRRLADEEPWKSQRLSTRWRHEMKRQKNTRACVSCTVYDKERPLKKAKTSIYSCSGCDNVTLCVRPPKDGRLRSCWDRWHSNDRINT